MQKNLKIYIIAGEPSGDFIGYSLIKQFLKNETIKVDFFGVGGSLMQSLVDSKNQQVFNSLFDIKNIAIMGFVEIIFKIFKIKKLINTVAKDIIKINPDVVITIDSLGFNKRVISKIKNKTSAKLIHYVAPTVWAWKPKRVYEIAKLFDGLLCLFEFEKKYFETLIPTYIVGHPIIESEISKGNKEHFLTKYNLTDNKTYVLLMPGSRITEVSRLLSIFIETTKKLKEKYPNLHILLPTVPHLYDYIKTYVNSKDLKNITIINNIADKYNSFKLSKLAIIASGTASLETSLAGIPTIVAYRVNFISYIIANLLIKIKYASIINIISNKQIIPEFLQYNCTVKNLYQASINILDNKNSNNNKEIFEIMENLGYNKFVPSYIAMNYILDIINKKV
jgi:lipid-A-disaccharide synthase